MEMAIGRVRESVGKRGRERGEDCMFIAEKEKEEEKEVKIVYLLQRKRKREECRVWHTIPEKDKEHFELFSMSPYFL